MSAPFFDPALALRWMRGNQAAVDFLRLAFQVAHLWDDLIDRDRVLADDAIHEGMFIALVLLPRNPFYRANFDTLNSILANASTNWRIATELERAEGTAPKRIAYVMRGAYVDLVTHSALLLGGPTWARDVGVELRQLTEPWGEYLTNLEAERAARGD
ncbi:MAG: hypothetical protein K0S02_1610 [Achromobacter mucicolens]|jgi:hypothetical protein|uniref:hypothetical protein n=1 Tax=Achromobacter mucicolens TaxID=1389922 RepID=UPI00242CA999|nr:hypothetical protein [Achromobacter mucicolens]MDF2861338.1 hypothetical protein [Achromobacter mucicolens]